MMLLAGASTVLADVPIVELVGQVQTTGACTSVAVEGSYAYLVDGKTLRILDVTTPTSPAPVGTLTLSIASAIQSIAVWRGVAAAACGTDGLKVIDVTRPAQPQLIGTFRPSLFLAQAVAMRNGLAYVANGGSPFSVVIADPQAIGGPAQVGSYTSSVAITDVAVTDTLALVTSRATSKGLQILDISNASLPSLRGTFTTGSSAESAAVAGNLVYIAEDNGVEIVDITNPALPALAGTYPRSAQFLETVTVADGVAYLGLTFAGFEVVDISQPTLPRLIDTYDPGKQPTGSAFAAGLFFGAYGPSSTGGLVVLRTYVLPTAPLPPAGFAAQSGAGRVLLRWNANREPDMDGYRVYRASSLNGPYAVLNPELITARQYVDALTAVDDDDDDDYWYKVTAVDVDGNESTPAGPLQARPGLVVVWLPDVTAPAGSQVRIPINVEDAQGINAQGLDIVLSYDSALIDPASVAVERTAVTSRVGFFANTNEAGVVRIAGIGQVQLLGEGHLFDIVARMKGGVSAGCGPLALDLVTMYDAFARSLEVDSSDTGQICAGANCKQGDLNNDGAVDSADALIALNIAVGIDEPQICSLESSDLNGDGRIDSADAVMIFRLAGGKPLNPPQGGKEGVDPADLALDEVLSKQAITVSVDTVEATVGSTVQVPVQINDARGLCGLDLTVSYPAERAKLTFQRVTNGGLTEAFGASVQSGVGYVKVSMGADQALGGKQEQTGSLVVLEFKVESAAEEGTTLPVAVNGVNLKGQYGESFDWFQEIGVQKGGIQITGLVQGSVVCNVIDSATQQPITNATLTITPSVLPPVSQNINGVYTFTPVPTGIYTIRATCGGYLDNSISVSVGQGTVSRTINLTREAEGEGEGQPEGEGEGQTEHTLTIVIEGEGTVNPAAGSHTVAHGAQVTLTATPAEGWEFDRWEGGLSGSNSPAQITVNADVTVTAVFTEESKGFFLCAAGGAREVPNSGWADIAVVLTALLCLSIPVRINRKT
jgi:hypothetical protein